MRYLVQLAMVALVLFSVSAALSLWLNQSRLQTAEKEKDKTEAADKAPKKGGGKDSELPDAKTGKDPRSLSKDGIPDVFANPAASITEAEERLRRRQEQTDLIRQDLMAERAAVDALLRQVTNEAKAVANQAAEAAPRTAVAPKGPSEADLAAERKNIEGLRKVYDAMSPESSAPIFKQMADNGRIDTAVQILSGMKDRQAGQVLAEIARSDGPLAAQLTDRILQRRPAPVGASSNIAPAGGTTLPPPTTRTP